jgi:NhaP-type Na+/H+ or K+/H+ antiporter
VPSFNLWFVIVGGLLVFMALSSSLVKRLPLTTAMLYLAVGFGLGPAGLALIQIDPVRQSAFLEHLTEIVVIVSLFSAGLKLRTPLSDGRWRVPVRLAFLSMTLTVGMVALVGSIGLGLPIGAAVLLGAVLAPTDPVLASDVQVEHPQDQDRLRFGLTGEAGLNDGTAFPFVMLGLGLLGVHEIGSFGWRWLVVDVVWAILGGLTVGALLGTLIGKLVIHLREEHKESVGLDDFLGLGLIALSYGTALLLYTYGFLAVFAAGLALRRIERRSTDKPSAPADVRRMTEVGSEEEIATDPDKAEAYMAQAVLGFSEQLERIGTVAVVLIVGGVLSLRYLPWEAIWFVPLLLAGIRPLSVLLGLAGVRTAGTRRSLIAWFGIRGIGSIYYLTYAVNHGLSPAMSERLIALTLTVVTVSIVVHGISVTPLMNLYARWTRDPTTPPA